MKVRLELDDELDDWIAALDELEDELDEDDWIAKLDELLDDEELLLEEDSSSSVYVISMIRLSQFIRTAAPVVFGVRTYPYKRNTTVVVAG